MTLLDSIKKCFQRGQVYYSQHARNEMLREEFGRIWEQEVYEAIQNGEIIEAYPEDKPFPSFLVLGKTSSGRPLHLVVAFDEETETSIIITVYQPDPQKWINFKQRKKT